MKKIYLLSGAILAGFALNAQAPYSTATKSPIQKGVYSQEAVKPNTSQVTAKAEGDTKWTNDFETASDWAFTAGAGHTDGNWFILAAMPGSLLSQAAGYGFTTNMNSPTGNGPASTGGGNFAFIDSDAAGGAATQNARFTYTSAIDLSAEGSTAMTLKFHQIFRRFNETYWVDLSNDGGTTWTPFQVNAGTPVNTNSVGTEIFEVNITSVIGAGVWSNDVRLRLRYEGQWDWFWGVDDIEIFESWEDDLRLNSVVGLAGAELMDYHFIPASQSSFPGFRFRGEISNEGSATQNNASLIATETTSGYNQSGGRIGTQSNVLPSQVVDTFEITNLFNLVAAGAGTYTVNLAADLGPNTDANPGNNNRSLAYTYGGFDYSRDNGTTVGGLISQITSQQNAPLKIGNVMEIFNNVDITYIKVYIPNLSAAAIQARIGAEIEAEITLLVGADDIYLGSTVLHTIQESDFGTWVTLPMLDATAVPLTAGDVVLVTANHFGGDDEMVFQMAQNVEQGTVLGYAANGDLFNLTSPSAIAIRLSNQAGLNVNEETSNISLNVYPNPAQDVANVKFELENNSDVRFTLTDLSGKVVFASAENNMAAGQHTLQVPTSGLANGVYMYTFVAGNAIVTEKLVINK